MKVGDVVKCNCDIDTWYKGFPGIIVSHERFQTLVYIDGLVIDLDPSSLEMISEAG